MSKFHSSPWIFRDRQFDTEAEYRDFIRGYVAWPGYPSDFNSNPVVADGWYYHERRDEMKREERDLREQDRDDDNEN